MHLCIEARAYTKLAWFLTRVVELLACFDSRGKISECGGAICAKLLLIIYQRGACSALRARRHFLTHLENTQYFSLFRGGSYEVKKWASFRLQPEHMLCTVPENSLLGFLF